MGLGSDAQVRRLVDRRKDLRADVRMFLYYLELIIGELALFVKYRSGNTDLAYVVKERGIVDLIALLGALAVEFGDLL